MIDLKHLIDYPDLYRQELDKRFKNNETVNEIISLYEVWKSQQITYDQLRENQKKSSLNIANLSGEEKQRAIEEAKNYSEKIKEIEKTAKDSRKNLDQLILKIPCLSNERVPVGKSDEDNVVIKTFGEKINYDFKPLPYWELPVYKQFVSSHLGTKAMGSRGYYMTGQMALFQRALFDYALDIVLENGFELFYVPLMLNSDVLTGTGHLPDFDGQQYEVPIDDNTSYYLIGSSEPSIMGYFMDTHLEKLDSPILATCWSSCFRKEAGSYGKDQQGILRVHQFEKVEMVAIVKESDSMSLFDKFTNIVEQIYSGLGLHYQAVNVCTGDMPSKHHMQVDYEAWFPAADKFREICSNGIAADFQNRGLGITYTDESGKKITPWGHNCTAVTFRTGLAILEQFQNADGSVTIPEVLRKKMKTDKLLTNA
jgi:seryl-tRNA synthetase